MALPDHRAQPESLSNREALPEALPEHGVQPGALPGRGAQHENPCDQEQLSSLAHNPIQLQSPTSGTTLPRKTGCDLT